ncbi:MAG: hypothetical protein Q9167_007055, partial [Letrouitia subvulpina]
LGSSSDMTVELCISLAHARVSASPPTTYLVLGLEYGKECWAGTSAVQSQTSLVGNQACDLNCAGDKNERCGGRGMYNYYVTTEGLGSTSAPVVVRTSGTVVTKTAG